MKTLVIPDIHNRFQRAEDIIAREADVDEIVFLGDYLDSWDDSPEEMRDTLVWLQRSCSDEKRIHLMGNHDVSYVEEIFRCSGWTASKQAVADQGFVRSGLWWQLAPWYETQGWLLSHAGVGQRYFDTMGLSYDAETVRTLVGSGFPSPFTYVSDISGGKDPFDGPLWLRPSAVVLGDDKYYEVPQIFGHTEAKVPMVIIDRKYTTVKGHVACDTDNPPAVLLDCQGRWYGVITDGTLEAKEIW